MNNDCLALRCRLLNVHYYPQVPERKRKKKENTKGGKNLMVVRKTMRCGVDSQNRKNLKELMALGPRMLVSYIRSLGE